MAGEVLSTAVSPFNPRAKGSSRKRSTAVPATEPGSTSMIAGPVAVIPLACGRLELGLWPCGRLDTMVAGPVAVDMLPTTYDLLPTTDYRLPTTDYR